MASFAAVGVGCLAPLSFAAAVMLVGAGTAGAMAGMALCLHYLFLRSPTGSWLKAFGNLAARKYDLAESQFQKLLEHPARRALVCLDPQYGSIYNPAPGNNIYTPERAIGHALLLIACNKANQDGHPKDGSGRWQISHEWRDELDQCQKYLNHAYHGLSGIEPGSIIQDLRTKHPHFITLPIIKSPGHGLLLTIMDWTSEMHVDRDFDAKSHLINHQGAYLENLKGWQASLRKCQQWMQRKKTFGTLERTITQSLLKAKNMRDFVHILKGISAESRNKLENSLVQY